MQVCSKYSTVLSPGAQFLLSLLQDHAKDGTHTVRLSRIGTQMKTQFDGFKKGCVSLLVKELKQRGLVRKEGHGGFTSIMLTDKMPMPKTRNAAAISPGASALMRALRQCTGPQGGSVLLSKLGTLVQKRFPAYKKNGGSMKALVEELVVNGLVKRELLADEKTVKLSLVCPVRLRKPRQKSNKSGPDKQSRRNVQRIQVQKPNSHLTRQKSSINTITAAPDIKNNALAKVNISDSPVATVADTNPVSSWVKMTVYWPQHCGEIMKCLYNNKRNSALAKSVFQPLDDIIDSFAPAKVKGLRIAWAHTSHVSGSHVPFATISATQQTVQSMQGIRAKMEQVMRKTVDKVQQVPVDLSPAAMEVATSGRPEILGAIVQKHGVCYTKVGAALHGFGQNPATALADLKKAVDDQKKKDVIQLVNDGEG